MDGKADVIVGAPTEDPGSSPDDAGRAYVFGGATGDTLFSLKSPFEESNGRFGRSVSGTGDVNMDGKADVIVGAPTEDPGSSPDNAGRAYVFGFPGVIIDIDIEVSVPENYALAQNYPNPFNPETEIRFRLPEAGHAVVRIYNTLGQEIRTLTDREYEAGFHSIRWDGKDNNGNLVASSIYLFQLKAGVFSQIKKMSLIR